MVCIPDQARPAQLALDDEDQPVGMLQPAESTEVIAADLAAQLLHHGLYDFDADPNLCRLRCEVDDAVFGWVTTPGPPVQGLEPPLRPAAPPLKAGPGEAVTEIPLPRRPWRFPKMAAVVVLSAAAAAAVIAGYPVHHPAAPAVSEAGPVPDAAGKRSPATTPRRGAVVVPGPRATRGPSPRRSVSPPRTGSPSVSPPVADGGPSVPGSPVPLPGAAPSPVVTAPPPATGTSVPSAAPSPVVPSPSASKKAKPIVRVCLPRPVDDLLPCPGR